MNSIFELPTNTISILSLIDKYEKLEEIVDDEILMIVSEIIKDLKGLL